MATFLIGTDSVHTSAAICDYLIDRVADGDTVHVINIAADASMARDGADALNAVAARLAAVANVETEQRETTAEPATEILAVGDSVDAEEILISDSTADAVGSVTEQLLLQSDRPVVVVPDPVQSA